MGLRNESELRVKLTGNWETIVGEQDTFCKVVFPTSGLHLDLRAVHILEYENYGGYDKTTELVQKSEASFVQVVK